MGCCLGAGSPSCTAGRDDGSTRERSVDWDARLPARSQLYSPRSHVGGGGGDPDGHPRPDRCCSRTGGGHKHHVGILISSMCNIPPTNCLFGNQCIYRRAPGRLPPLPLSGPAAGGRSLYSAQALSCRPTRPGDQLQASQNQKPRCWFCAFGGNERTNIGPCSSALTTQPHGGGGGCPCTIHRTGGVRSKDPARGASSTPGCAIDQDYMDAAIVVPQNIRRDTVSQERRFLTPWERRLHPGYLSRTATRTVPWRRE